MLDIYSKLFDALHAKKIPYCLYKSLNFLEADLAGERGDLDVVVAKESFSDFEKCASEVGFKRVYGILSWPVYFVGRDRDTQKFIMIDADICFRFGPKPVRPFRIEVDWTRLLVQRQGGVNVLAGSDYFILMLMMRLSSSQPKLADLLELKALSVVQGSNDLADSQLFSMGGIGREIISSVKQLLPDVTSWDELQGRYKSLLMQGLWKEIDSTRQVSLKYDVASHKLRSFIRKVGRFFHAPAYRVRSRGHLVALVGVDGAGKSSAVEAIMRDKYYQLTGVKRVYFGFNEYRIHGVVWLNNILNRVPVLKYVPRVFMALDRQFRIFPALYYCLRGNLVICDRYYYDDEISRELLKQAAGPVVAIKNLMKPRMLVIPDLAIYLNVSPEVAYGRKQDYSFETMLLVNEAYRTYMAKRQEALFIDADRPQAEVLQEMFACIQSLDGVS